MTKPFKALVAGALLLILGLGIGAAVAFSRAVFMPGRHARRSFGSRSYGSRPLDFTTTTFDGRTWSLSDQRGKVVVIDFWASWCGPCRGQTPFLKSLYRKYRDHDDFVMVGVSLDEEAEAVSRHVKREEIDWLQLFEPGKAWNNSVALKFHIYGIPSLWVIDKRGSDVGAGLTPKQAEALIDRLLAGPRIGGRPQGSFTQGSSMIRRTPSLYFYFSGWISRTSTGSSRPMGLDGVSPIRRAPIRR